MASIDDHLGLFDYADSAGDREVFLPLAAELASQQENIEVWRTGHRGVLELEDREISALDWAAHVMQERTDESRNES